MTLQQLIDALTTSPGAWRPGEATPRLVASLGSAEAIARTELGGVRDDSRAIEPDDVFVAVRGRRSDGHAFIGTALERGAAAVVVEAEQPGLAVPQIVVASGARAFAILTGAATGHPARRLTLVGITGTNGKTTTTYLIESILRAAGEATRPGVIGTVDYRWHGRAGLVQEDAPYTTPTAPILHATFARMADDGVSHAVMEVSSAALEMDRLGGLGFAVGAFSNLTQDHLDVHGTMAAYQAAKRLLFAHHLAEGGVAVVNVDDVAGEDMAAAAAAHGRRVLRVSSDPEPTRPAQQGAEIRVTWCESTVRGIRARVRTPRGELEASAPPLIGAYNVANLALAVGIAEALGLPHAAIVAGIAALPGVPGRVERVGNTLGLDVLVDYAHTPDALRNVLSALRPLCTRRLLCVFGCGGDRDPGKRPLMGAAVAELADLAIVTSDNPRTEAPRAILDQILPAVPRPFFVDVDRRTAIRAAVAEAMPGDIVLIAGKGHEDYQILGTSKIHFDDREEAAAAMALRPRWPLVEAATTAGGVLTTVGTPTDNPADLVASRVILDGRTAGPGDLYVAIRGAAHDGHAFCAQAVAAGAVGVVVEAGQAAAVTAALASGPRAGVIAVDDTRLAIGRLGQAHRRRWGAPAAGADAEAAPRLIAITGSSGKTTTKELTRAALARAAPTLAADGSLNNETGVPLTLLALRAHHRVAVVEMGMRGRGQIEYLTRLAEPDVAVVVNAGSAHIELLGSTEAIAAAKAEIWLGLRPGGVAIVPADDERLIALAARLAPLGCKQLRFGEAPGADVRLLAATIVSASTSRRAGTSMLLEVLGQRRELLLPLLGRHAAIDACAALAAAVAVGVDLDLALAGLAAAGPAPMRGELVEVAGRTVIVDCYNANPGSMAASLTALAEAAGAAPRVAVVGDMLELGPESDGAHRAVGARAAELGLPVIALGAQRQLVVAGAGAGARAVDDPAAAAHAALAQVGPGGWILLKASRGMKLERVLEALRVAASEARH
ncbi:MAG: UDP-N-acetylmuramoyl-L-alanyl-D-glutamate--2,6-diaminopimelate ligase [Kofleriaceae bacterium]|nr:UDP-N-acetylmuramoyl-L-alanyl-D-glutamate--2,6-diaminopimelate ligase [Kofleriaceae bacterium]